jgi:gluconolactonase
MEETSMPEAQEVSRRRLLQAFTATGLAAIGGNALAQAFAFTPNQRYPDPAVLILDPAFAKYRIYSSTVEQVATGMRWAEGPVYFPDGGYVLVSDIPNNRIMKFDEKTGAFTVFRANANYANGNARDRQGRLVSCEHSVTRRITRTERDGRITVLAENFEGKRLNAPNDIVVKSDDSIWFTDPLFGINGEWEGTRARPEQATTNVYRIAPDGRISAVITDLLNPNGLAFSPDEKTLYVANSDPKRAVWMAFDVAADGTLNSGRVFFDVTDRVPTQKGLPDGMKVDARGNVFATGPGGVLVFDPDGTHLGTLQTGQATGNCAWGEDGSVLYINADMYLCRIRLSTKGNGF